MGHRRRVECPVDGRMVADIDHLAANRPSQIAHAPCFLIYTDSVDIENRYPGAVLRQRFCVA